MKEHTLIEMKNKIETLGRAIQFLMQENKQLKDLSVGTLETIKQFKEYDGAIEKLKEKMVEEAGKAKEAESNRKIIE